MTKDTEQPINVIILDDVHLDKNEMIDSYIDILKTCRTAQEFYALFEMVYDDVRVRTLREILVKDIQNKASVLQSVQR